MKELVRAIKRAGKSKALIWMRDGEYEYIKMGPVAIKTETLKAEELGALVSFFGEIPREGTAISQRTESNDEQQHQIMISSTINHIFNYQGAISPIINTNLLVEDGLYVFRAFFSGNKYYYIYEELIELFQSAPKLNKVSEEKAIYTREDHDDHGEERYLNFVVFFRNIEEQNPFLKELK